MDIFGSLFGLICLAPFFFLIACLIKLTSRGPVFYNPLRAGLGGKPFHLYKFRTMIDGADSLREKLIVYNERSGPVFKMTNDPRVTSIGNFLRMWSLDELPQLINVLKGDMSLVGPRPLDIVEEKSMNDWHRIRRTVKPGMTCLWQISDRKNPDFDEWVRLDGIVNFL